MQGERMRSERREELSECEGVKVVMECGTDENNDLREGREG